VTVSDVGTPGLRPADLLPGCFLRVSSIYRAGLFLSTYPLSYMRIAEFRTMGTVGSDRSVRCRAMDPLALGVELFLPGGGPVRRPRIWGASRMWRHEQRACAAEASESSTDAGRSNTMSIVVVLSHCCLASSPGSRWRNQIKTSRLDRSCCLGLEPGTPSCRGHDCQVAGDG